MNTGQEELEMSNEAKDKRNMLAAEKDGFERNGQITEIHIKAA